MELCVWPVFSSQMVDTYSAYTDITFHHAWHCRYQKEIGYRTKETSHGRPKTIETATSKLVHWVSKRGAGHRRSLYTMMIDIVGILTICTRDSSCRAAQKSRCNNISIFSIRWGRAPCRTQRDTVLQHVSIFDTRCNNTSFFDTLRSRSVSCNDWVHDAVR